MSEEDTRRIEKCAGDWVARRDAGNWSAADQSAFDSWLNESTSHRVAYLRIENAWHEALRLKALGAGVHSGRAPPPGEWRHSPFFTQHAEVTGSRARPIRARVGLLAASLVLAVAIGSAWYLRPDRTHYSTPVGGVASLPMSDGSKVILNTNSEIDVVMSETERRVELKHGEAFFEVAKDARRPFIVSAGDKRIVAVGTQFSVRREIDRRGAEASGGDEIKVVVTEGVVRVESESASGVANVASPRLAAGSVARVNRGGLMVQTGKLSEAEEQLSWRSGDLVFRDVTLGEAAAEFNRYNERKIVIEDAATAGLLVAGNFRTTNVDAFIRLLEQGYPVRTDPQGNEIRVSAR